jgi:hypothetical protein
MRQVLVLLGFAAEPPDQKIVHARAGAAQQRFLDPVAAA